jgi:hypothetical protein
LYPEGRDKPIANGAEPFPQWHCFHRRNQTFHMIGGITTVTKKHAVFTVTPITFYTIAYILKIKIFIGGLVS